MAQKNMVKAVDDSDDERSRWLKDLVLTTIYFLRFDMADREKQLVLAIIDFLNKSINDGTVKQDDKEGLEVAGAWCLPIFCNNAKV